MKCQNDMTMLLRLTNRITRMDEKNRVVAINSLGAFVIRGLSLIVSFFSVPAYISYFNDNVVLGIWYTVLSIVIWALNFDLGIGNGIRNLLVKALSSNDKLRAKEVVSSGMFANMGVMLLLTVVGSIVIRCSDLTTLFNLPENHISTSVLTWSTLLIFLAIMLRFFLTSVSALFFALQRSMVNNMLGLIVSVLQLVYVLTFRFDSTEDALIALAVSYIITSNLPAIIAGIIVFARRLNFCSPNIRFVKKQTMRDIMSLGGLFFFCQVLYMVIMNTNEFIITYYYGAESTVEYTFYQKLFFMISGIVSLAVTPIWSMVTKAYAEKQFNWLNTLYRRIKMIGIVGIGGQFLLIPFLQVVMNLWLGDKAPQVDYGYALAFAAFGGVFTYSSVLSTITCGLARMKLQLFSFLLGVIAKVTLLLIVAPVSNNWSLVVWSNVLILTPYCILQQIDLNRFFLKESAKVSG